MIAGKYRIIEEVGRGGMGVVYEAEDTKLGRKVAVKVLPEAFNQDPERLARFEREARVLAALNHPNIAAIHGVEEDDGRRFLILEFVEGETLADRLGSGSMALEDALEVCRQIAEGLEGAHEKGIIHRDLKPANVKITPEGKVKILDFGLAKALRDQPSAADIRESPTITADMTAPGVMLGTAAYMSPEQTVNKAVDKRADIWAFGCILYECLAGKRAFPGDTVTEIIAAILRGEPDWDSLPAGTPGYVRTVLGRCLQKDPKGRLHDIADARLELESPATVLHEASAARRFPLGGIVAFGAGALVLGLLTGPAMMKLFKPAASPKSTPVTRSIIKLEEGCRLAGFPLAAPIGFGRPTRTAMALSRDGRWLVYAAAPDDPESGGSPGLFLQRLDELRAKPIPGTEGGNSPFLSPDDRWVGFWAGGKLMKVPVEGGAPTALCDVAMPFGFAWGDDGWIVFSSSRGAGLTRIRAEGGSPESLTTPDFAKGEFSHRLPHALPGAKGILFTIKRHAWDSKPRVAVLEPRGRTWKALLEDAADARYIPSGHLVFLRRGTLMAARFDPDRLEIIGQPVSVLAGIEHALATTYSVQDTGAGQFGVSAAGTLVYAAGGIYPNWENTLVWFDREGRSEPATSVKAPFWAPRLSPDGRRIAVSSLGLEFLIRFLDLDRGVFSQLTTEGMSEYAAWTPDGRRVAFDWVETGVPNLFWQPVDGSSPMERLTQSKGMQFPGSWSPDGRILAFLEVDAGAEIVDVSSYDILLLHMADRSVTPFLKTRFNERAPAFSPNGRWLTYMSDETGRDEVYLRPFPGPGGKWQVSTDGGVDPQWARDGRELFYRKMAANSSTEVYAVDVRTGPELAIGKPRFLFAAPPNIQIGGMSLTWDISPDGKKFLMVKWGERKARPVTELVLVLNWIAEVERLDPAGKK